MKYSGIVTDLFKSWKERENKSDYTPEKDLSAIRADFIVQILLYKLLKMNVPVIFPYEALSILAACSQKPDYIQIMAKEVLTTAMNSQNDLKLPIDYVITTNDFSNTWPNGFPILAENNYVLEDYKCKRKNQKDYTNPIYANRCDTTEWWNEIHFK